VRPVSGWGGRVLATLVPAIALAGCAGASPSLSTADPVHDLITIDQLVEPGFTVTSPSAHVAATTLGDGDAALTSALAASGLQSAASIEFQRGVDFSTSNGPIDIVATVERLAAVSGASNAYAATVRHLDATPGAVPTSTGPLGDAAHATSVVRTTLGALQAVEITVVWRVHNLVNIMVVRGRYGGTRLNDALVLAGLQTQNESAPGGA
jgi:hypothetical protein